MNGMLDQILAPALNLEALEKEIDDMVEAIQAGDIYSPDLMFEMCVGYMARCTEIWNQIVRVEGRERKFKFFRTSQLQKVMDLIDFTYKATSRMTEVRRQDMELNR